MSWMRAYCLLKRSVPYQILVECQASRYSTGVNMVPVMRSGDLALTSRMSRYVPFRSSLLDPDNQKRATHRAAALIDRRYFVPSPPIYHILEDLPCGVK